MRTSFHEMGTDSPELGNGKCRWGQVKESNPDPRLNKPKIPGAEAAGI